MKRIFTIIFILMLTFSAHFSYGESSEESNEDAKKSGIVGYPYVAYTPETKFMIGLAGVYFFRPGNTPIEQKPSVLTLSTTYTQKNQFSLALDPELHFKDGMYTVLAESNFEKFPDKFYGLGNDTEEEYEDYTKLTYHIRTSLSRKIFKNLKLGITCNLDKTKLKKYPDDGMLSQYGDQGLLDTFSAGFGFLANYDSRDNVFYPANGSYHILAATWYDDSVFSDTQFSNYVMDLREYLGVHKRVVLASRLYVESNHGDVPISMMPKFGGSSLARGYYEGRYMDKNIISLVAESRINVWKRISLVLFGGYGDVSHKFGNFQLNDFKYSYGLGLRYMINQDEKITVRFDYGIGDGVANIYLSGFEAF